MKLFLFVILYQSTMVSSVPVANIRQIADNVDELSDAMTGHSGYVKNNHTKCKLNVQPYYIFLKII